MNEARRALAYLREHGWLKADFGDPYVDGPACLQALNTIKGVIGRATLDVIKAVAFEQYPERYAHGALHPDCIHGALHPDCILHFNDHRDTTFADVERVLEKAAVRLDEEVDG